MHSVENFVLFSLSAVSSSLWPHGLQHTRLFCPSVSSRVWLNSRQLSWWYHPTISSSVAPSPPSLNLSQHQGLFQRVGSFNQWPKYWGFRIQFKSFQWIFRTDFLSDWLAWSPCCPRDSQESSPAPQFKSINSLALSLLCGPTLTSIHDYWKNHSFD